MQIWQRNLIIFLTGLVFGVASTIGIKRFQEQHISQPSKLQLPPSTGLTSGLMLEGEPAMGNANAPITIVGFSDFECSYCRRFHKEIFPQLKTQYINTGLVRFIHKDLPLPFHRHAFSSATATRCAGEQSRYWDLYNALFDQQNCLSCKGVLAIAAEEKFDTTALQACMERQTTITVVNSNRSEALLHNINATPTFVIGPSRSDGKLDGRLIEGVLPWSSFRSTIEETLQNLGKQ